MDENNAIQLCIKEHDPRGFEFLVEKYRKEAFFHAISFLGNQEDAADACQESFTKAFMAIPRLDKLTAFYPWFYRILKNSCLNMLQRKKTSERIKKQKQEDLAKEDLEVPSLLMEKDEEQVFIWQILKSLNPEFREILVMKYIEGLRYEEISERLKIPRGSVMSRLYHARKAFRDKYLYQKKNETIVGKEIAP